MKTLIEKTDSLAKYLFTSGDCTREFVIEKQEGYEGEINFEEVSDKEYLKWLKWISVTE
jgi:hypothetical protein